MLWLKIIIGIILFIMLILLIPVGVKAEYSEDFKAVLKIGFVSIKLYPPKPKKPKKKKETKKKPEHEKKEEKPTPKKQSLLKEKGISELVDLIRQIAVLAGGVLKDFFRHIIIKNLQISITYCGVNAEDTAVKYGYFCLSVYPAVSIIADVAKCKHYGVDIAPNFNEGAESIYYFDLYARTRTFWLVGLVFKHGFKIIKLIISLRSGKTEELEKFIQENNKISDKGASDMEHPIGSLMNITMEKIKEMVDVNTIVGEPITSPDGTLIIPVSKVSYGFASGGSDLPTKKENKDCFGGGSGAGVTIQPVAFLTVYKGNVKLVSVDGNGKLDNLVGMIPEFVTKVKDIVGKKKNNKDSDTDFDDFSEITVDDIDI